MQLENKYLVLKRDKAEKMISPAALKEVEDAMAKVGYDYFVVNLDEEAGRQAMRRYFDVAFEEKVKLLVKEAKEVKK